MRIFLILIYILVLQLDNQVFAQANNKDYSNTSNNDGTISVSHKIGIYTVVDSLYPLKIKYTLKNGEIIHGKFSFDLEKESQIIKHPYLIGVYPAKSKGLDFCYNNSDNIYTNVSGSFNNGIPSGMWTYERRWIPGFKENVYKTSRPLTKFENYEDGVLHGEYIVDGSILMYRTTFKHGTGYYKDFYPLDNSIENALRVEGALVNGLKVGTWLYYIRSDEGNEGFTKLKEIYFEYYDNGELSNQILLKPEFEIKDKIKKAIEWERQSKKVRKGKENPYLE